MTTDSATAPAPEPESLIDALKRFFRRKLQEILIDTRFFLEVLNDKEAGLAARGIAFGVVWYLNHARDLIPDRLRVIGLIDDIIVMTIGMSLCLDEMPAERRAHYESAYPAARELPAYIDRLQRYLSLIWERLLSYVRELSKRHYRGQPMEVVVDSPELLEALRDETMEYLAKATIDPDTLDEEMKKLPRLDKVAGLLTDALAQGNTAGQTSDMGATQGGLARLNRILGRSEPETPEA